MKIFWIVGFTLSLWIIQHIIWIRHKYIDCEKRNGTLVQGAIGYVCVKEADTTELLK